MSVGIIDTSNSAVSKLPFSNSSVPPFVYSILQVLTDTEVWSDEQPLLRILRAHALPPTALRFNPSGNLICSGSADNTVRVITVPETFDSSSSLPSIRVLFVSSGANIEIPPYLVFSCLDLRFLSSGISSPLSGFMDYYSVRYSGCYTLCCAFLDLSGSSLSTRWVLLSEDGPEGREKGGRRLRSGILFLKSIRYTCLFCDFFLSSHQTFLPVLLFSSSLNLN